jgi:carboxylate-amine ligase
MSFDTFRGSPRPSLGVELEFQLLDAHSLALTGACDEILAEVTPEYQGSVKPEFYDSCVEINTGVCGDLAEVERDLGARLDAVARVAGRHGVLLGWGGTHPFSHWRDQSVVTRPRYRELAEQYRETLCRQVTFGLHVHVGVGDGDTAIRVCNRIVEHLPAFLALSANSPFWCRRATGHQSYRVEVMEVSPTGGLPPRLGGWDDYARFVERLVSAGLIGTAKELWWDVRPNSEHGTVELRMCDMPPDLPSVLGLTALTQCLVTDLAQGGGASVDDECGLMIVRQNRWRASRYGLGAEFIDPRTGCPSPAREPIKRTIERLRGVAAALGCARQLEQAHAMANTAGGAERQLTVFERTGDLLEVVRQQMIRHGSITQAMHDSMLPVVHGHEAGPDSWPRPVGISGARSTFAVG